MLGSLTLSIQCRVHGAFKKAPNAGSIRRRVYASWAGDDERDFSRDIPLPQGVWWLKHARVKEEAAFGSSFVIHRAPEQSTDIVVTSREDTTVQVWHPVIVDRDVVIRLPYRLLPPEFDSDVYDVEVEEVSTQPTSALAIRGVGPVCETIPHPPTSPRRTQKVKFTCNRCQTQTEKFVNPLAWNRGVVFCRCDGCDVVHLIQDSKGIFSSLKGHLFPQSFTPETLKIPEGLPQNPQMPDKTDTDPDYWLF